MTSSISGSVRPSAQALFFAVLVNAFPPSRLTSACHRQRVMRCVLFHKKLEPLLLGLP